MNIYKLKWYHFHKLIILGSCFMEFSQISSNAKTLIWPTDEEIKATESDTQIQITQVDENQENTTEDVVRKRKREEPTTPIFKNPSSNAESPNGPYRRAYKHVRDLVGTTPEAQKTLRLAWKMQEGNDIGIILKPTENARKTRRVTKGAIYIDDGDAGRGTQTTAVFSQKISTKEGGTPIKKVVIKDGGKSLKQEKDLFDQQFSEPEEPLYINGPKKLIFLPETGKWMAEYKACTGDLSKVNYNREDPATYAINLLLGFVNGTQSLHEHGVVHRDIKGGNLLFNEEEEGIIADLGLMMLIPKEGETHRTTLTPTYAASFIWPNILGQKTREGGHQDEAADVYALGCVTSRDILKPMIVQLFKKHGLDPKSYLEALKPQVKEGKFSDKQLLDIEAGHKGQVVYFPTRKGDKVYLFPARRSEYEVTCKAIDQLEEHLPKQEIKQMKNLAVIAHNFRSSNRSDLTVANLKNALQGASSTPECH